MQDHGVVLSFQKALIHVYDESSRDSTESKKYPFGILANFRIDHRQSAVSACKFGSHCFRNSVLSLIKRPFGQRWRGPFQVTTRFLFTILP